MATTPYSVPQRSLADVLRDIFGDLRDIIRAEFRLFASEFAEKANRAVAPLLNIAVGAVFAIFALGFVLLTAMFALSKTIPIWGAALLIGVVSAVLAASLVGAGRASLKNLDPVPRKTIRNVQQDVQTVKESVQ